MSTPPCDPHSISKVALDVEVLEQARFLEHVANWPLMRLSEQPLSIVLPQLTVDGEPAQATAWLSDTRCCASAMVQRVQPARSAGALHRGRERVETQQDEHLELLAVIARLGLAASCDELDLQSVDPVGVWIAFAD